METQLLDCRAIASDLAELDPGELLPIGDGVSVRYLTEVDDFSTVNDFDYLGRIAPVERDRYYGVYPHAPRPDGFDGSAKILTINGEATWWQPPTGWHTTTDETKRAVLDTLYRIIESGFQVVTVEVVEGNDHYGRPIVRNAYSLCGVEPWAYNDRGSLVEVLCDLVGEVL